MDGASAASAWDAGRPRSETLRYFFSDPRFLHLHLQKILYIAEFCVL